MNKSLVNHSPVSDDTLNEPVVLAAAYGRWIERTGLADLTKDAYHREVRNFTTWLAQQTKHVPAEVFTDPHARDYAVRDYRRWMLTERKRAPKGIDLALTSLGSLFGWLGLGPADVKLVAGRARGKPKGLSEDQVRDVLRAAQRRTVRDHALVAVAVTTGLRVSELAALNTDDVWVSERKGQVQVRAGKGDKPRTVGLVATGRGPLAEWLRERNKLPKADTPPLWLTRTGGRLAVRSVRYTINEVGRAAGVDLHPHLLRHTAARTLVRNGEDLVTVAGIFGWSSVETARNYTDPTIEDMDKALEHLNVDY